MARRYEREETASDFVESFRAIMTLMFIYTFMYADKTDINGNNVLKCLQGATLSVVEGLVANCSTFLEENIESKNVCTIHEQAIHYNMKALQTNCFEFMIDNASSVFKSKSFLKISKSTLVRFLKRDDLADYEDNVFTAVLSWAEAQCSSKMMNATPDNKRKCLGEALNEIRFPIMSIEIFAKLVTPAEILTSDEQVKLYQYIASNGTTPLNTFIARKRFGKVVTIDMKKYGKQQGYLGSTGYFLNIKLGSMNTQQGNDNYDVVKIMAVTCTFAAEVKRVCNNYGRGKGYDFKVQGDKIIFHSPLLISNHITVIFETAQTMHMFDRRSEVSHNVECTKNVNRKTVNICMIPKGLTSITFAM